jgi:hypothetical protein
MTLRGISMTRSWPPATGAPVLTRRRFVQGMAAGAAITAISPWRSRRAYAHGAQAAYLTKRYLSDLPEAQLLLPTIFDVRQSVPARKCYEVTC